MAARYVRIGQYPDYRDEIRGTLLEILASTANPGTYAAPEDVSGCTLEMGADGLWTGNLGTLTQAQANDLVWGSGAWARVVDGSKSAIRAVYTDFTLKPDGALPSKHDGSIWPIRTYYPPAYGAIPLVVSSGSMKSQTVNPDSLTVCYTETDMLDEISVIGSEFAFQSNGGAASTICLAAWGDSSLVDTYSLGRIPTTGCHLTINYNWVSFGIWDKAGASTNLVILKSTALPELPRDGTPIHVDIIFDRDLATVVFRDYNFKFTVKDSRILSLGRRYACWETYQKDATKDTPSFSKIWCRGKDETLATITTSLTKDISRPLVAVCTATSSLNVTANSTEIDSSLRVPFIAPASGKILAEFSGIVLQTGASGAVLIEFRVTDPDGSNSIYKQIQMTTAVGGTAGLARALIPNIIPGAKKELRCYVYSSGTPSASVKMSITAGLIPTLMVTPL